MGLFSFFRKKTATPTPADESAAPPASAGDEAMLPPPAVLAPAAPVASPAPAAGLPAAPPSAASPRPPDAPLAPAAAPSPPASAGAARKRWWFGGSGDRDGDDAADAPVADERPTEVPAGVVLEQPAAEPEASEASEASDEASDDRRGWFAKLRQGLRKTGGSIARVFTGTQIDDALYEDLEAALLMADVGVKATSLLLDDLKRRVKDAKATDPAAVRGLLAEAIAELLAPMQRPLQIGETVPTVMMVVGVNGAGKTTTIGKLTRHLAESDCKVLLAAADTFRAAAREQLGVWADRNKVEIVSQEGGDPSAVSFDAVKAGIARRCDVVIADTAGRLPTQLHLMDELKKLRRTLAKAMDSAPHEVLLVVDGNTGQNALAQVKAFDEALGLTGLVVTKLDGTAKGGVLAAIALWARERAGGAIPIYFIGVGEKLEDLQTFDAREFAQALLG